MPYRAYHLVLGIAGVPAVVSTELAKVLKKIEALTKGK